MSPACRSLAQAGIHIQEQWKPSIKNNNFSRTLSAFDGLEVDWLPWQCSWSFPCRPRQEPNVCNPGHQAGVPWRRTQKGHRKIFPDLLSVWPAQVNDQQIDLRVSLQPAPHSSICAKEREDRDLFPVAHDRVFLFTPA